MKNKESITNNFFYSCGLVNIPYDLIYKQNLVKKNYVFNPIFFTKHINILLLIFVYKIIPDGVNFYNPFVLNYKYLLKICVFRYNIFKITWYIYYFFLKINLIHTSNLSWNMKMKMKKLIKISRLKLWLMKMLMNKTKKLTILIYKFNF